MLKLIAINIISFIILLGAWAYNLKGLGHYYVPLYWLYLSPVTAVLIIFALCLFAKRNYIYGSYIFLIIVFLVMFFTALGDKDKHLKILSAISFAGLILPFIFRVINKQQKVIEK